MAVSKDSALAPPSDTVTDPWHCAGSNKFASGSTAAVKDEDCVFKASPAFSV
jgi:hypothetical protein